MKVKGLTALTGLMDRRDRVRQPPSPLSVIPLQCFVSPVHAQVHLPLAT